jgi:hypothetical protein
MVAQETALVNNTVVINNPVEALKMVQLGHLHGSLFVYQFNTEGLEPERKSWPYQKYLADTFHPASREAYERFVEVFEANEAIGIYSDWKAELDRWFDEHRGGPEAAWNRIVLISVAACEGLDSEEILRAADTLAPMLRVEKGDAGGLTGLGVEPTLRLVGAERAEDGRVRFTKPGYAAAVLDYVWSQLPRIHTELLAWTDAIAADHSRECLDAVRDAWVGLALRRNDPELTIRLLNVWMEGRSPKKAVAGLAAEVASWPDFGSKMRRRLYEWARNPKTDEHAAVVAMACASYSGDDAVSALFRLKWLAQAESEKARESALNALVEMAADTGSFFDVIRVIVDDWSHTGVPSKRREIAHRFISGRLAHSESGVPVLLLRTEAASGELRGRTMRHVADMWRSVLGQRVDEATLEAVGPWVSCALESESRYDMVSRIFAEAVAGIAQVPGGAEASRRTVTLGQAIIEWCERQEIDQGSRAVYGLLTRLYTAHEPFQGGDG